MSKRAKPSTPGVPTPKPEPEFRFEPMELVEVNYGLAYINGLIVNRFCEGADHLYQVMLELRNSPIDLRHERDIRKLQATKE